MIRAKTSLPAAAAIAAAALLFAGVAKAQDWTFFTNEATFTNSTNIASPFFTETFSNIPTGTNFPSLTNLSGNGYSFGAISTSNDVNSALYGITNHWLTVNIYGDSVVFTNFSTNVTAIGGYFFGTDYYNAAFTNSPIKLTAQLADSTIVTTNVSPASATSFYGFTFATNVSFFSIGATNTAQDIYPTAAKVIVGTTVPEPSSLALLLLGAGAAALLVFKTRRA